MTSTAALVGSDSYWRGLLHGLLLALPLLALVYRKWKQCADALAAANASAPAADANDAKAPTLGTFLNELFTYEVVLVAGAEMKAVKDQLAAAEQEGNARRIEALKGRLLDVARVLDQKLQVMLPIVRFLTEQSVACMRGEKTDARIADASAGSDSEDKKDK